MSLLLLLYIVLIHLLYHICSLTIPLLWHASRYCWSYGYLREFLTERGCEAMLTSTCFFLWSS
jgi:hypothetical protein